jgi:hypothetical protein
MALDREWAVTGHLGADFETLSNQDNVDFTVSQVPGSFSTDSSDRDDWSMKTGVGISTTASNSPLSVSVNYDVQMGDNTDSDLVSATAKYKF